MAVAGQSKLLAFVARPWFMLSHRLVIMTNNSRDCLSIARDSSYRNFLFLLQKSRSRRREVDIYIYINISYFISRR